jgi:hypothetical protein
MVKCFHIPIGKGIVELVVVPPIFDITPKIAGNRPICSISPPDIALITTTVFTGAVLAISQKSTLHIASDPTSTPITP